MKQPDTNYAPPLKKGRAEKINWLGIIETNVGPQQQAKPK